MIAAESALDFDKLNRCRMDLLEAAQAFLVAEHEQTLGNTAGGARDRRVRILADLNDLRLRHSRHIAAWNPRDVTADWPRYLKASHALVAELNDLLRQRRVAIAGETGAAAASVSARLSRGTPQAR